MKEAGYPMEQYKLRIGLLGSETCTPEMRTQIENSMGIFVSDNYGMTELGGPGVSGECGCGADSTSRRIISCRKSSIRIPWSTRLRARPGNWWSLP